MAATVTVTGTAGPGQTVTAQVITGVTSFSFDCVNNIFEYYDSNGAAFQININAATTITATKSGSNYTLTIS